MHQVINTKQVAGAQHVEYFIESADDLANLPQEPSRICCLGSVAYTPQFDIYFMMSSGWEESS